MEPASKDDGATHDANDPIPTKDIDTSYGNESGDDGKATYSRHLETTNIALNPSTPSVDLSVFPGIGQTLGNREIGKPFTLNLADKNNGTEINVDDYKCFEDIKHVRNDGSEFWSARELAPLLGYAQWRNFSKVIDRAMIACDISGYNVHDEFAEVKVPVKIGATSRKLIDYELSRYACYVIVQNGDPRKDAIALGQSYFAIQTYRQEIADRIPLLDEDDKRLILRGSIKQWNQLLAEVVRHAGVVSNEEFAMFQNAGYMGLYGGLTVEDIHKRKKLTANDKILDFMGNRELVANLFRIVFTEDKFHRESISNKESANATHHAVGAEVRETIRRVGGSMPEDMPVPEKSIGQLEKERLELLKHRAQMKPLMLDE
jgi:DNA-damage-inducible protein D